MERPNLKNNFIFRLLYDMVTVVLPFITMPYVTRVLGPDGCGIYSYTHANVTYFVLFAVLGTSGYGIRTISRNRDNRNTYSTIFWEIEMLTICSSLIALAGFFCFFLFLEQYRTYYLILSIFIVSALLDISWFFTGLEQLSYMTCVFVTVKVLGTISIFVFVRSSDDLLVYFIINASVQFLSNLSMWIFAHKFLVRIPMKELHIFRHLKETLIFFIPTIAISIYTVLDKTLIGLITQETAQNGFYDNATQVINGVKTLVYVSIGFVMGARTSYLFANNRTKEVKEKIELSMNYIMFLAIGFGFGILGVASNFVPLFLGKKFAGAIPLLKLMTPLIAIVGISNCLGSLYYNPVGKRKTSAGFIIIGALSNLLCNLILIPHYGARGATIGTIIAESVISLLYLFFCDRFFSLKQLFLISYRKLFAGGLMLLEVIMIGKWSFNPYVVTLCQIIVGGVTYIVLLFILRDPIIQTITQYIEKSLANKRSRCHED